jgi:AhpD family alkylhydroperoxidase
MRLDHVKRMPDALKAMTALVREVRRSTLEPDLVELVKLRASQINGCAYCVDTHVRMALAKGEEQSRLHLLAVWRDAPGYTPREQAALRWCEELTLVADSHASDPAYAELGEHFSEDEIVALTYAVISINGYNRLSVAFRQPVVEPAAAISAPPPVTRLVAS